MKVLIATDGSEYSRPALEAACRMLAGAEKNIIKIITVYEPPLMPAPEPYVVLPGYYDQFEKNAREQAARTAASAEQHLRERFRAPNFNLTTQILKGSPEKTIIEEARGWGADLIIMGSHGYGFWSRAFLGSVSNAVVNHAPCSVLVVKNAGESKK